MAAGLCAGEGVWENAGLQTPPSALAASGGAIPGRQLPPEHSRDATGPRPPRHAASIAQQRDSKATPRCHSTPRQRARRSRPARPAPPQEEPLFGKPGAGKKRQRAERLTSLLPPGTRAPQPAAAAPEEPARHRGRTRGRRISLQLRACRRRRPQMPGGTPPPRPFPLQPMRTALAEGGVASGRLASRARCC